CWTARTTRDRVAFSTTSGDASCGFTANEPRESRSTVFGIQPLCRRIEGFPLSGFRPATNEAFALNLVARPNCDGIGLATRGAMSASTPSGAATNVPPPRERRGSTPGRLAFGIGGVVWLGGVGAGFAMLSTYKNTPATGDGYAPLVWPTESAVHRVPGRATL